MEGWQPWQSYIYKALKDTSKKNQNTTQNNDCLYSKLHKTMHCILRSRKQKAIMQHKGSVRCIDPLKIGNNGTITMATHSAFEMQQLRKQTVINNLNKTNCICPKLSQTSPYLLLNKIPTHKWHTQFFKPP